MRTALILAALALASGAAAEPQPATPEVLACGKLGAAWIKQHPLPKSKDRDTHTASFFYSPKTNQCWIVRSDMDQFSDAQLLIDAQTGIETMACHDMPSKGCAYISEIKDGDLASGFMAVPLPPKDSALAEKPGSPKQ